MAGESDELRIHPLDQRPDGGLLRKRRVERDSETMERNAADIEMSLDALEMASARPDITTFVLVCGDRDFIPIVKRLQHPWILAEVRNDAKFNLVVVRDQHLPPRLGTKGVPKPATLTRANRDVVQVGGLGREPSRAGHGLVKRGVDAAVRLHRRYQRRAVRAA